MKFLSVLAVASIVASSACAQGQTATGAVAWSGTFTLPRGTESSAITLVQNGRSAIVTLAPGRAARETVRVRIAAGSVRFSVHGRPGDLVFDGRIHGRTIRGKVRQGPAHGSFVLRRDGGSAEPFLGTYALAGGRMVEAIDLGRLRLPLWLVDLGTGAFHALFRSGSSYRVGGFNTRQPADGSVRFTPNALTWTTPDGAAAEGTRLPVRQEEVRFPSTGAVLSGTLTIPDTPGPHPAVAWVHGSGPSLRDEGQFFVGILVREGIAVLNYDKRGNGSSTGSYPGELATDQAISTYADDAAAAARFLAGQPDLDPKRIGLVGGSQGGWVISLAATREPAVTFAIVESGPTVSVGETANFSALTSQGGQPLTEPLAQIDSEVRRDGPSGFDPRPLLRKLHIPILWLFGALDMNQPTDLDVESLQQLQKETGADFSWRVFPDGNHGIFEVKTGLNAELEESRGMPPEFFATVHDWIHAHGL